ncbi:Hypothetical predicted protein [Cloeon dipterum]|uniref:Uncharacterized protein n=1 Tax=Cloeon dipterum TaxID=197152 RepID=A0A8S1E1C8_9INSE|nr:Hypothetical predicted protein [Cloeon dipterum]
MYLKRPTADGRAVARTSHFNLRCGSRWCEHWPPWPSAHSWCPKEARPFRRVCRTLKITTRTRPLWMVTQEGDGIFFKLKTREGRPSTAASI